MMSILINFEMSEKCTRIRMGRFLSSSCPSFEFSFLERETEERMDSMELLNQVQCWASLIHPHIFGDNSKCGVLVDDSSNSYQGKEGADGNCCNFADCNFDRHLDGNCTEVEIDCSGS